MVTPAEYKSGEVIYPYANGSNGEVLMLCQRIMLAGAALAALALGAASGDNSGLMAGVNDVFRQGGMALGVAAFGALVPAAAALGH
ncbi:MAG TPA: hypothetical protein VF213_05890, partial [Dongiaceae bacterium]